MNRQSRGRILGTRSQRAGWKSALFLATLMALAAPGPASATWPADPTVNVPLSFAPGRETGPVCVTDGAGGAIVVYQNTPDLDSDIYAQRVDSMGVTQWGSGVPVVVLPGGQGGARVVSDGAGGAIIAWTDFSLGFPDYNVRAQRIDASGTRLWNLNGVAVCLAPGGQNASSIASDGAGGAIVTWMDARSAPPFYAPGYVDIYAQHVDGNGNATWATDGLPVCSASGDQGGPVAVSDGSGGAIISWTDGRGGSQDIYAQRVSSSGAFLWLTNGTPVSAAANNQILYDMASDGAGGLLAIMVDYRLNAFDPNLYLQRLDSAGAPVWATDGVPVCTATSSQLAPRVVSDGAGGGIVSWMDTRGGVQEAYAQRIGSGGSALWASDGVPITTHAAGITYSPVPFADGAGGAIIAWPDLRGSSVDIYAQRVDPSGARVWKSNGVAVCTAPGGQGVIGGVADGVGGVILAWTDPRNGNTNWDIFAQRVEHSGSLSGPLVEPGNIAGRVTTSCPSTGTPLLGVTIDAFEVGSGDLLGTAVTDANGNYFIPEVEAGDYTVSLVVPLGMTSANSEVEVTIPGGETVTTDFALTCVAASGKPNTSGFWKHQFGVATGGNGTSQFDATALCGYLDMIEAHFNNNALNQVVVYNPPSGSSCAQKLELAKTLLNLGGSAAPIDKARQQLLSLLLNVAANYLTLHDAGSKDGATVSQAITYCDQIIDNPSGDYGLAASIADKINSGQMVNAGVIPLGTQNIAYAMGRRPLEFSAGRNPATGPRTFSFTLGAPAAVDLSIYDVHGRRVAQVYSGTLPEGRHSLPWNGASTRGEALGRGIYFSRLVAGGQTQVRKLVQTTR